MYHHLNFLAFRILQHEPNFSWQINSISYNPTACFVSSFYTLYSTVEPTLPLLQPCKPLTTYFMPVWAKSTPSHLLTLQDPIVSYQFLHYSPTSHTNLTNPRTYCFQYHMHDPLKAIYPGFGWVYDTESAWGFWVSFVWLIQRHCFQDVHWIGNTYKLFSQNNIVVT